VATGKRTGKRSARDTLASEALPFKKRPDLNRAPPAPAVADDDEDDLAEEGAEMALVRMRCIFVFSRRHTYSAACALP